MGVLTEYLWYIVTILVVVLAVYFTYQTCFFQIRHIGQMAKAIFKSRRAHKGNVSPFQILMTSIGTRVGSGNIIGVCIALYLGGPGAILWMWIMAILNMSLSLVETILSQVYKVRNEDGTFRGGPAYYIEKGLNQKWMSIAFACLITICFVSFTSLQVNISSEFLYDVLAIPKYYTGIGLFFLVGLVILGSVRSIATISEIIVPVMSVIYTVLAITVSIINIDKIPDMIVSIFYQGLGFQQLTGGVIGGFSARVFSTTLITGIRRGMFSNEAGLGSIPCISGSSDVKHPATQGYIEAFGVIIDTIIICSATAFIVLSSGALDNYDPSSSGDIGALLIRQAFDFHFGTWAGYLLTFSICTFAFTSMLGNYYIGETNIRYLYNNKSIIGLYQMINFAVILLSTVITMKTIINFADTAMGIAACINLIAIFTLRKVAIAVFNDYQKELQDKEKDPFFHQSKVLPNLKSESWVDLD